MVKAYINIDTKNGKNGQVYFFKATDVEEAKAWAKGYEEEINQWKNKKNFQIATMSIFNQMAEKVFFTIL